MYYASIKPKVEKYGRDTYSISSLGFILFQKKDLSSNRCCGRGCKPCFADLGL